MAPMPMFGQSGPAMLIVTAQLKSFQRDRVDLVRNSVFGASMVQRSRWMQTKTQPMTGLTRSSLLMLMVTVQLKS